MLNWTSAYYNWASAYYGEEADTCAIQRACWDNWKHFLIGKLICITRYEDQDWM